MALVLEKNVRVRRGVCVMWADCEWDCRAGQHGRHEERRGGAFTQNMIYDDT